MMDKLKKNPVFKLLSSVRLAVPLMLVIAGVVGAGTLYESRYTAEVAGLMIYRTWWFEGLMVLLGLNILCAALSRIPYKRHHTGFVITHIGLLTLLIGAKITAQSGIDGQMRVLEGGVSKTVILSDLVLRAESEVNGTPRSIEVPIKRSLEERDSVHLDSKEIKDAFGWSLDHYFPFVEVTQVPDPLAPASPAGQPGGPLSVAFKLKSPFFEVSESLNSENKDSLQMGPATLRLLTSSQAPSPEPKRQKKSSPRNSRILLVRAADSGADLAAIPLSDLKKGPVTVAGKKIDLIRSYEEAVVAQNKLTENGTPGANPALELKISALGKEHREITYARFKEFSLSPTGILGLRFEYQAQGSTLPSDSPPQGQAAALPQGNVIDFRPIEAGLVEVTLSKAQKTVLTKTLKPGEALETPWMGMQITLISSGSALNLIDKVNPIALPAKSNLPPSAILVRPQNSTAPGEWLVEGQTKEFTSEKGPFTLYYGPRTVETPFEIKLNQFRKKDYPGTQTALSFESTIQLGSSGAPQVIQMNEPLQEQGWLLYQSSYEMGPGIPTASIFSVNKDPGRFIKYMGAIILIIGIVLFTLMRSKWYQKRWAALALLVFLPLSSMAQNGINPENAQADLVRIGQSISSGDLETLPVQSHGRLKPLLSLSRETILYLTGKYGFLGLDPIQLYLGLTLSESAAYVPVINIRDPDFRVKLGFTRETRHVSLQQLSASPLESLAKPILEKEERNARSVTPDEKKILEVQQQYWLMRDIVTGGNLRQALILDPTTQNGAHAQGAGEVLDRTNAWLDAVKKADSGSARRALVELSSVVRNQPMPDLFREALPKMDTEVFYLKLRPFLISGLLYLLIGFGFLLGFLKDSWQRYSIGAIATGLLLHSAGFGLRVYITGFAPVTNMFGTMIWMSFGVILFGLLLFLLYRQTMAFGVLLLGSGLTLLLTESIPLILSPDMDPVVAVLRNNFWLSTHVLTVSISYAAFTITMLLGNTVLILKALNRLSPSFEKQFAHITYRSIQLGVFLLTAGIILGGWWADYSWGRFWGWDPKETWALIADLGFLAILHARYVGWLKDFGLLAASPLAYLLVIMAWYGVNFILAAGLHSYGFSSGGATIVLTFTILQILIFAMGILRQRRIHA